MMATRTSHQPRITLRRRQRGFITLFSVLIIMVALTLVTIFTTRSLVYEQRMNANEVRYQQAFSAAKAALDEAFAYLREYGPDRNADSAPDNSGNVPGRTSRKFAITTAGVCAEVARLVRPCVWARSDRLGPTVRNA